MHFPLFIARVLLLGLWLFVSCVVGLARLALRWGDLDTNRFFGRIYSSGGLRIVGWKLEVEGRERLKTGEPCVFVTNHQSNLDMIICGSFYPRRCIVIGKKELLLIPLFGIFFAGAGNVLLDRKRKTKALGGLDQAVAIMKEKGVSIWIFPEGTRNRTEDCLQPFKKGAFHMAIRAQVPVVPIVIQPLKGLVDIWSGLLRSGTVRVRVLEPIPTVGMGPEQMDSLLEETRKRMKVAVLGLTALP